MLKDELAATLMQPWFLMMLVALGAAIAFGDSQTATAVRDWLMMIGDATNAAGTY